MRGAATALAIAVLFLVSGCGTTFGTITAIEAGIQFGVAFADGGPPEERPIECETEPRGD